MNKKLLSVLLALSMMTGAAALADGYTAGTYTGRADGRNGEITVDVTFSEDAITDIVVKDHQETAALPTRRSTICRARLSPARASRWTPRAARPSRPKAL